MLQRDRHIRTLVNQLTDGFLFAFSYWLAYGLRYSPEFTGLVNNTLGSWLSFCRLEGLSPDVTGQPWNYFFIVPAAPLILESMGFYNRTKLGSRLTLWWSLFRGCALTTIGLVLSLYVMKEIAPRGVMTYFGMLSFLLIWLKEEILAAALHSHLARAQYKRRVILAGIPAETARQRREILAHTGDSIEVRAEFNLAESSIQHLIELLHEHSVSAVIVSARHTQLERVENIIKACETEGVEAWLVADFFATQIAQASFDEMLGHPLIIFRSTPETSWQMLLKLLLDFFGALVLLAASALPMLLIAGIIKLGSRGPVLFRQQRSGLNGEPFTIYKFRTMMTNAEQFQHELAAMNEMTGPVFKVTDDPRVTAVGKWLRKWSLDELPQLFNILKGEMSLVGPRPLPVDEVKRFNDLAHRRRLSVKPGLTCLWQISGRNQISDFRDWVRLDLEYIDTWSIWLDLKILLRTVPAVLRGTGAK